MSFVEMFTEDCVDEFGLRDSRFVGSPLDELFVFIADNDLFIIIGEGPGTYVAVECASTTGTAFHVIALFAERLPIPKIIRAVPGARNLMIWTKLHSRLFVSARRAFVAILLLDRSPRCFSKTLAWFAFLAYIQTLKLVASAFLPDRSEAFFSLQLPHAAEDVFVGCFPFIRTKSIHGSANIALSQRRSRNAMPCRPKRPQDNCIVPLVGRTRRNKARLGIREPLFPSLLRLVRSRSGSKKKTLAGPRCGHIMVRP